MSKTVTSPYDVAEHLRTPEEMAVYLEASIEEADGDAAFIAKALGDIARAKGMSQVASDAGLSRESLYKALSGERNPTLDTVLRVVGALGLKLRAEAVLDSEATGPDAALNAAGRRGRASRTRGASHRGIGRRSSSGRSRPRRSTAPSREARRRIRRRSRTPSW